MNHESVRACDQEAIRHIWDKLPKGEGLYWKLDGKSYENFYRVMQESCLIWELPIGFIRVEYHRDAGVWIHGGFWTHDVFREVPDLRELAYELMDIFGVYILHIAIPVQMKGLAKLLEKIGATWRGVARRFYSLKDHCGDALVYDIIDDREGVHHE